MQRFHDFIFAHVPQHQPCLPERRLGIHQTRPRRQPQRSCDRPSRGRLGVRFEKDLTLFVFASLFICRCLSLHLSFFVFVFLCLCPPACWVQPWKSSKSGRGRSLERGQCFGTWMRYERETRPCFGKL